jgi:sigma-B regulation protein RsbU (phosphoserine phosphatase)
MKRGESGSAMVEIDGVPSWIYYRTVKHMDWMIAIVVPQEVIAHKGRMLNTTILIVVILGLVAIYFICRQMIRNTTRPLHLFARSAEEVAKGNFSSALPDVKSHDEVRMLHDSFKAMQTSLSIYVDEVKRTTAEKAAIKNELSNARALVPNKFPPYSERGDIDTYGMMEPAKSVGGDLFDYWLHDDRLFFCIGDVSGKGMPAALLMAVIRARWAQAT